MAADASVYEEVEAVLQPVDTVEDDKELGVFGLIVNDAEDGNWSDKHYVAEADNKEGEVQAHLSVLEVDAKSQGWLAENGYNLMILQLYA